MSCSKQCLCLARWNQLVLSSKHDGWVWYGRLQPLPPSLPPPADVLTTEGPSGPVEAGTRIELQCSLDVGVRWLRNGSTELPDGATVDGGTLTFDDPQPDDSGVYMCCRGEGDCAEFDLQIQGAEPPPVEPTEEDDEGDEEVSTLVIIIVAVVGGVSLFIFLTVIVVAMCYFCRKCRGNKLSE